MLPILCPSRWEGNPCRQCYITQFGRILRGCTAISRRRGCYGPACTARRRDWRGILHGGQRLDHGPIASSQSRTSHLYSFLWQFETCQRDSSSFFGLYKIILTHAYYKPINTNYFPFYTIISTPTRSFSSKILLPPVGSSSLFICSPPINTIHPTFLAWILSATLTG